MLTGDAFAESGGLDVQGGGVGNMGGGNRIEIELQPSSAAREASEEPIQGYAGEEYNGFRIGGN